jgi:AraC-like DNA-binding protein
MKTASSTRTFSFAEFFTDKSMLAGQYLGAGGNIRTIGQSYVASLEGKPIELDLREEQDDTSHIDFIFFRSGGYSYLGSDGWVNLDAQLIVAPKGLNRKVRLEGKWKILAVRLPREAVESFTPPPPNRIGSFKQLSILERAMYAFASSLISNPGEVSAVETYALEQLLFEMSGATLLDRMGGGWAQGAPHAVMLDRAKAVIAQQCSDPQLTPSLVAHEVKSSLRQLQKIFSDADTSLAVEIRARRAYTACALFRDARYDVLTVDQIAERSGFGTTMSMRRALADIYGLGPREMRHKRD